MAKKSPVKKSLTTLSKNKLLVVAGIVIALLLGKLGYDSLFEKATINYIGASIGDCTRENAQKKIDAICASEGNCWEIEKVHRRDAIQATCLRLQKKRENMGGKTTTIRQTTTPTKGSTPTGGR